jgi:hypothetical protein
MADVQVAVMVGDKRNHSGKTVNVYTSYANALLHGATGLATIKDINKLTGAAGSAITQVAKTTGFEVDQFGMIHGFIDDGTNPVFLMSDDHWGPPRRLYLQ